MSSHRARKTPKNAAFHIEILCEPFDQESWLGNTLLCRGIKYSRIGNPPCAEPSKVTPLFVVTLHAEHNGAEKNEESDDGDVKNGIYRPSNLAVEFLRRPVHAEACCKNGKVQSGIVMMNISDSSHGDKWQIV